MTTQLTISNPGLKCDMIVRQLKKMKLDGNVIEGKSLVDNQPETSCQITFAEEPLKLNLKYTWEQLKKENYLKCGHLKIDGKYSGCVLDYLEPTICNKM
jgi:hypothetical protein